jgi:hypothetical protein
VKLLLLFGVVGAILLVDYYAEPIHEAADETASLS